MLLSQAMADLDRLGLDGEARAMFCMTTRAAPSVCRRRCFNGGQPSQPGIILPRDNPPEVGSVSAWMHLSIESPSLPSSTV